jgi:hypothetical protein
VGQFIALLEYDRMLDAEISFDSSWPDGTPRKIARCRPLGKLG